MTFHPQRWAIGLVPLAFLWVVAVLWTAGPVEADLGSRIEAILAAEGFAPEGKPVASVAVVGRDAFLTGAAPSAGVRTFLHDAAQRVHGVRKVIDGVTVTSAAQPVSPLPAATGLPRQPPAPAPDPAPVTRGAAESVAPAPTVAAAPSPASPALVTTTVMVPVTTVAPPAPVTAPPPTVVTVPAGPAPVPTVAAVVPPALPLADPATPLDGPGCQARFAELLRGNRVTFEGGTATLEASSLPLLGEIAATARRCPDAVLSVAAASDRGGPALARLRSEAVAERLRAAGLAASRVEAGDPAAGETGPALSITVRP